MPSQMKPIDEQEIRKYRFVTILLLVGGVVLLSNGIWMLCVKAKPSIFVHLLIGAMGGLAFVLGLLQWLGFSKGTCFFKERRAISLQTGEFVFDEPHCPYGVWIFCDVPFSRYYGSICVTKIPAGESQIIKVPRRSLWLLWWWRPRSDVSPITWKSSGGRADAQSRCFIKFDLKPAFAGSVFDEMYPTHDVESVTVLIMKRCVRGEQI